MLKDLWRKWREPKPFHEGYLPEADGHHIYFAEYGNPKGQVVLVTHGGPGGASHVGHLAGFCLKKYRVIRFDQRGCGKSLPFGKLENNTMDDLVWDIKRLYDYLHLSGKVILRGGSWGSTVMLCFAEKYPELVKMMILSQIFLADKVADDWFNQQSALFYPEFIEKMTKQAGTWKTLPEYYWELINAKDEKKRLLALNQYGWYERVLGNFYPHFGKFEQADEQNVQELRIYLHYAIKAFTLKNNQIMRHVRKISHIPTLLLHNRLDMCCPLFSAYKLHQKMTASELKIAGGIGHTNPKLKAFMTKEIARYLEKNNQ